MKVPKKHPIRKYLTKEQIKSIEKRDYFQFETENATYRLRTDEWSGNVMRKTSGYLETLCWHPQYVDDEKNSYVYDDKIEPYLDQVLYQYLRITASESIFVNGAAKHPNYHQWKE